MSHVDFLPRNLFQLKVHQGRRSGFSRRALHRMALLPTPGAWRQGPGGGAHSAFPTPYHPRKTRPQRLPIPATRDGALTFLASFNAKRFWFLPAFALAHLAGFARKGTAPLR